MDISTRDREVLRELAERQAEIAALSVHQETIAGWKRLNSLGRGKPMIWINEIPWHEMDVDGELTLQTTHEFSRIQEQTLRRTLYQWEHMRGDMVVDPVFYCPLVVHDTGFGIGEDVEIVRTDDDNDVVSRGFHAQIDSLDDVEKIRMPVVTYDAEATESNYHCLVDLFGDILPIQKLGQRGFWFAPWDELIRWWDVQKAMLDLVMRPELVHAAMDRLVDAYLCRLDQYEEQGLLALNNNNVRVGSGGLGFNDELPTAGHDPAHDRAGARTADLWGCATAQIFGSVSPAMHEEFALQYERRWLQRFGLNYYGCCEPLHQKLDILASIPGLRKISMSPWVDIDRAAAQMGDAYVFSRKPNPAIFAWDVWDPAEARRILRDELIRADGCVVEIIAKDISTVRYEPQRLWEWSAMAREVTEEFG